ncbi:hypothetical protein [Embleya sp. AB8]|uniref:hypothetical protein n=1 Tax=Embleya sp. AB8 TaxID=3156304 RepID=UPI003C73D239
MSVTTFEGATMDDEELSQRHEGIARALDLADLADAIIEDAERQGLSPIPAYVEAFTVVPAEDDITPDTTLDAGGICPVCRDTRVIIRQQPLGRRYCVECQSAWFLEEN